MLNLRDGSILIIKNEHEPDSGEYLISKDGDYLCICYKDFRGTTTVISHKQATKEEFKEFGF